MEYAQAQKGQQEGEGGSSLNPCTASVGERTPLQLGWPLRPLHIHCLHLLPLLLLTSILCPPEAFSSLAEASSTPMQPWEDTGVLPALCSCHRHSAAATCTLQLPPALPLLMQ